MNKTAALVCSLIIIVVAVVGLYLAFGAPSAHAPSPMATSTPVAALTQASYSCDEGKTVHATYTDNQVALTLSDGRTFTLPQTMSGSGIRYEQGASTTQDIVWESKGADAFLTENGKNTFNNCLENASAGTTNNGMSTFTDSGHTFSFEYPSQLTVTGGGAGYSQDWMTNATTSGLTLAKMVVPKNSQPGTNFDDATFKVGTSADPSAVATCLTYNPSGGASSPATHQTINGINYTVFKSNDAGAGNRYDTTSYRTVRNSQCYAIEYTIHSSAIGNYPAGTVKAFDEAKVMQVFNTSIQSFKFL